MASNRFLQMLFGQGTEPTYAGLRMPRQRVEDDARLIRQGNPQERFRDYHNPDMMARTKSPIGSDVLGLAPLSEEDKVAIQGDPMEAPNSRTEDNSKRDAKLKGAISGLGQMFASAMQPEQTQPLQFAQLQQQQLTPLIDPRWLPRRADGGPVKKKRPYIVGEDGPEVIIPNEDGEVIPNRRNINWDVKGTAEQPVTFPDDVQATETVTPDSVTETVTEEPSIADVLRAKIDERQKRLAEGATKNEDGTTMYGGKKYRKRNAFDALKSAGLGVLQSLGTAQVNPNDPNPLSSMLGRAIGGAAAGGVMGATMNNVDERMMDKMKIAQLTPQYEQAYGMERQKKADDTAILNAESLRKDREKDNIRNAAELRRKIEKDAATTAYWNRKADQGELKIANDVELMALRDKWATSKNVLDKRRLDLVEKEMVERTKRNQANINSREKIAGMSQENINRRQQIAVEAQKEAAKLRDANASGRQQDAIKARERLIQLRKEDKALTDDESMNNLEIGVIPLQP